MEVVNDHSERAVQVGCHVLHTVKLVLVLIASWLFKIVYCV